MFIRIAILLYLSRQALVIRTSNFIYKKGEPLNISHYLTSSKCEKAIQCAVACFSLPGCGLADLDSGNLYKKVQAHSLGTILINHYVESRESHGRGHASEAVQVTQSGPNNISDVHVSHEEIKHLLVVKQYGHSNRDVFKVSLPSKTAEKTGITLRKNLRSIVYDRKNNTLFWSGESGIFKQVLEFNSKIERLSSEKQAFDLNIYNDNLAYRKRYGAKTYIYTPGQMKSQRKDLLLSVNARLLNLVIDYDTACWLQCKPTSGCSINCFNMSTKTLIYAHLLTKRQGTSIALLKTSNYGFLVFIDKGGQKRYTINVVEITPEGLFGKAKTVHHIPFAGQMKLAPGLLVFSSFNSNKVEIWNLCQNGSFGEVRFQIQFPFKFTGRSVLLALG